MATKYHCQTREGKREYIDRKARDANPEQKKKCAKCKEYKLLKEFHRGEGPFGKRSYCKDCSCKKLKEWRNKNPERYRELSRKHSGTDKCRNTELIRKYGITLAQYNKMLIEQRYVCKICHKKNNINHTLYVDHHHESGVVRGLLCQKCNLIIGMCDEKPEILLKIVEFMISKDKEIEDALANIVG